MRRVVTIRRKIGETRVLIDGVVHLGTWAPDNPDEVSIAPHSLREIELAIAKMVTKESVSESVLMEEIERDLIADARHWAHSHGIDTAWDATDIRDANGVRGA